MSAHRLAIIGALFLAATLAVASLAHEGATGVVKERMDAMESMEKLAKAINDRIKAGRDLAPVKQDAEAMQKLATGILPLFPPGSNAHPSAAKDAIWQNWPDFEARARALEAESGKLAATDSKNPKALLTQYRAVFRICSDCHETYRATHHHGH